MEKTPDLIAGWDGVPLDVPDNEAREGYLSQKIKHVEKSLQEEKKKRNLEGTSRQVVEERLAKALNDQKQSEMELNTQRAVLEELKNDCANRTIKWSHQLRANSKRINKAFKHLLDLKKSRGEIDFDHENRLLHVECQTDKKDENTKHSDVRNMSGGERSFVTLCLLLAIGSSVEAPFRVMDEYDVFMDQVTRARTLQEIMEQALAPQNRDKQFVIVTPQQLNNVVTKNEVRINKMPNPKREGTHALHQATLDVQPLRMMDGV